MKNGLATHDNLSSVKAELYIALSQLRRLHAQHVLLREAFKRAAKASFTDGLTKLINKSGFNRLLLEVSKASRKKAQKAARNGETVLYPEFSVLIIDIDNFKLLNSELGHDVVDQILKRIIAPIIKKSVRQTDIVGSFDSKGLAKLSKEQTPTRWGGDEFAIILPECSAQNAVIVAERIRSNIEAAARILELPFTASIGVFAGNHEIKVADFLAYADNALYAAKAKNPQEIHDLATIHNFQPPIGASPKNRIALATLTDTCGKLNLTIEPAGSNRKCGVLSPSTLNRFYAYLNGKRPVRCCSATLESDHFDSTVRRALQFGM